MLSSITYDLDIIRGYIARCECTYAKTYPTTPHEYIVRGKCPLTEEESLYFVKVQRAIGIPARWGPYNFPYLHIDGYKYWTMGSPLDKTIIINRAKE